MKDNKVISSYRCFICNVSSFSKSGNHYGVHYQKSTDLRPCFMSCKSILFQGSVAMMDTKITQQFMLSWHQRQFLYFLADRASITSINPEAEAVAPHWYQIEDLKRQGLVTILDIVGSQRKDISLTNTGKYLVSALKDVDRKNTL